MPINLRKLRWSAWVCFLCAPLIPAFAEDPARTIVSVESVEVVDTETLPGAPSQADFDSLKAQVDQMSAELEKLDKAKKEKSRLPSYKFSAELQADASFFGQDSENRQAVGDIQDGTSFRRARAGILGDWENWSYRLEMDFAQPGRPTFLDVWLGASDVPLFQNVRVGHFFEPFSLERLTSNRFQTFIERSLRDSAFDPARNLGVAAFDAPFEEQMTWAVGFYRTNSNNLGDDIGDDGEWSGTGRLSALLYRNKVEDPTRYLHVGTGYSFRGTDNGQVRFRSQPEVRHGAAIPNVPFFVDTGSIPSDYYQLIGVELAGTLGPFSVHAESTWSPVATTTLPGSEMFWSAFVQSSVFLTGEHRPYKASTGTFDRVLPRHNFGYGPCGGLGAWELALRLSTLDLNSGAVRGGELTDITVALNWYLNPYVRSQLNYIHAFLEDPILGASDADIVAMRIGIDY